MPGPVLFNVPVEVPFEKTPETLYVLPASTATVLVALPSWKLRVVGISAVASSVPALIATGLLAGPRLVFVLICTVAPLLMVVPPV